MLRRFENKKAMTGEFLKILLAVISIVLLLLLAGKLIGLFSKKTEIEQAREGINTIDKSLQEVLSGKEYSEFFLESPREWWIIAWPHKDYDKKPDECKDNYCLCLCKIPSLTGAVDLDYKENSLKECNTHGFCKDSNIPVRTYYFGFNTPLRIGEAATKFEMKKENDEISVEIKE